jgi:hypothetical protein
MFIPVQLFLATTGRSPPRTPNDSYCTTLDVQVEDCDRQFLVRDPEIYKMGKSIVYI